MSSSTLGEIITFYSYKGGTGRSMALSNVACILAEKHSKGKGVLIIDWDLEAPGLHRYFHNKLKRRYDNSNESVNEFNLHPGLIDLFLEFERLTPKIYLGNSDEAKKDAIEILKNIDLEKFVIETEITNLSLLKAGCFDKNYSTKVNTFNWEDLYNRSPYLFISFAEKLVREYKYVLIDSRTGYTDISGICTALMPQKLVVVFTPNRQNYMGVEEIVRTATDYRRKSEDLRPLLIYPLPTRIESSRDDLRAEWRSGNSEKSIKGYQPMFQELFEEIYDISDCNLNGYFEEVQIQHSPDYAYGEEIAVMVEKFEDRFSLSKSYRVFTEWLLESRAPWQKSSDINISRFTNDINIPRFTEIENRILTKYISDLKLSRSLTSIRGVMENIWANEAPRIVKDYTDHGEEHSKRVAFFAEKLLQPNPDAKFSQQEIYLLLAGIYLHDIGMQCDIAKYPEIKKKAESLGAQFKEAFTSKRTSEYSLKEQREIRKNHHLLSAAWIDYLYEGNDPVLSHGIKSIPYDLVDDLMDVCKFHSKLSINECSEYFNDYPNSRKKMVASLLRFADELDISSTRVNIETVNIFSIDLNNSIYWWLHNNTNFTFIGSNKIRVTVSLHPEDFDLYSSFVREEYITNFINRNKPVLDVLVGQKIPVVIDNNSDVVAHTRAEKFPPEITSVLDKKIKKSSLSSNIPYSRNQFFTDRQQTLEQIHETFHSNKTVALSQPVAICGLGGIGKTQIAIEYTYRYCAEYEFIFWVTADSEDSIISDYIFIAKLLDLPIKEDSDQNLVISAVKNWLRTNDGWLLVFDNADSPYLIEDFLPLGPKGHILLTSRAYLFDNLGVTSQIKIEKMLPDEAREFFIKRTGRKNLKFSELKALDELTSELDYLPLAIEQAGAYIRKIECSFEDYLSSYKENGLKLLEKSLIATDKYPKSVATTWLLNLIRVEQTSKASAEILFVSAFLNPSQIPVEIFIKGAKELGPVISSALKDVENDPLVLDGILEPLTQYSLITRNTDSNTYDINHLVQAVLRDQMNENTQKLWVERAVKALNCAFPEINFSNWQLCDRILPHVQTCIEFIEEWSLEIEEYAKLLNSAGNYLCERSRLEECELFFNRALKIREKVLDSNHPDIAESLNDLAVFYEFHGKYSEAEPLLKRALDIREKVLDSNHPDIAESLNNLAGLYQNQGRYSEAEPLYNHALEIQEKVLGSEHPDVATSFNNLAELYRSKGKYSEAEPLYKRALDIREKVLGSEHPDVAMSINNLALLYQNQGRYSEAEPLYKRALNIREKVLGSEHPRVANSLNNLAGLYQNQGRYSEAEPLYKRALNIREKVLGSEHPHVANSLNNLAGLYESQGRYSEAESLYKFALDIRETVLGSEHPDVAMSLNNLAALYESQGKYSEVELLLKCALEIQEKVLGSGHPDVAMSLNNLALLYQNQGRCSEAKPLYKHALDIREKVLGSEHPDVANSLNNLAALYESQGKYSEAEPLFKRALEIQEKVLGSEHPDVAMSLNNLALLYQTQGRYSEAESLFKRALEIQEKVLGSEHPSVANSLNNLAAFYMTQGKNLKAKELFLRSIDIMEKSKGEYHPDFLKLLTNYANLLIKMRKGREASKMLNRVEYIRAKNKGHV